MKRFLISAYTGLGNFVLKTPLIKELKQQYPNCHIDIIAGNSFGTEFIIGDSDLINETHILKEDSSFFKKVAFFRSIKKKKYDAIFLAFDSNKKFLFFGSYIASIKSRVVHFHLRSKIKSIFFLFAPNTLTVPLMQGRHEIDLNLDLIESYINKPLERDYDTFVNTKFIEGVYSKFNLGDQFIVLQPGAANGSKSAKKWSSENFVKLIRKLNNNYPKVNIVTVGDKGDYLNDIKNLENKDLNFINTAGLTTIDEVTSILQKSSVVIANDSGIMHIANALNSNLIALYGPTDYTRTRPLGKNTKILYSKSKCFAKMYNFTGNETELATQFPDSMDYISVDQVYNEIEGFING